MPVRFRRSGQLNLRKGRSHRTYPWLIQERCQGKVVGWDECFEGLVNIVVWMVVLGESFFCVVQGLVQVSGKA